MCKKFTVSKKGAYWTSSVAALGKDLKYSHLCGTFNFYMPTKIYGVLPLQHNGTFDGCILVVTTSVYNILHRKHQEITNSKYLKHYWHLMSKGQHIFGNFKGTYIFHLNYNQ